MPHAILGPLKEKSCPGTLKFRPFAKLMRRGGGNGRKVWFFYSV
jgi:hypothetical protein